MAFNTKTVDIAASSAAMKTLYGITNDLSNPTFSPVREYYDQKSKTSVWEWEDYGSNGGAREGRHRFTIWAKRAPGNGSTTLNFTLALARVEAGSASASGFTPAPRKVHDVFFSGKLVRPPRATDEEMGRLLYSVMTVVSGSAFGVVPTLMKHDQV